MMPFSHHSHSGQFCPGHAQNSLEEMVQRAIALEMEVFALTEHMPRSSMEDLYPEELEDSVTPSRLLALLAPYFTTCTDLQQKYASQIQLLVGFETEWIRGTAAAPDPILEAFLSEHAYDFVVGSVHHVHGIPIDYDREMYERARHKAGGTDEDLCKAFFDAQFEMLQALKPPVVGHFDLCRLKSDEPDRDLRGDESSSGGKRRERVWDKVLRNLDYVAAYGGLLEINTSGLRKGLKEPYPKKEVCQAFLSRGGRFTLSDDSHSTEQIGTNYHRVLDYLVDTGILTVCYLERRPGFDGAECFSGARAGPFERFPNVMVKTVGLDELRSNPFWGKLGA